MPRLRHRLLLSLLACLLALGAAPGRALAALDPPLVASDNVKLLANLPEAVGAISLQFSSNTPHAYVSTLKAVQVYDIANPAAPRLVGVAPLVNYQNEAMSLGERPNGDKFLIIASTRQSSVPTGPPRPTTGARSWWKSPTPPTPRWSATPRPRHGRTRSHAARRPASTPTPTVARRGRCRSSICATSGTPRWPTSTVRWCRRDTTRISTTPASCGTWAVRAAWPWTSPSPGNRCR